MERQKMEAGKDIETTELGYYLLSELITMPDRILAQKIELDIWTTNATPRASRLKRYIDALAMSDDSFDFYKLAEVIVVKSELIFHINDGVVSAEMPSL